MNEQEQLAAIQAEATYAVFEYFADPRNGWRDQAIAQINSGLPNAELVKWLQVVLFIPQVSSIQGRLLWFSIDLVNWPTIITDLPNSLPF